MDTMINIVQNISKAAIELANLILIYGSAIWIGVFFLKSLSSATAQDPTQVLTALFTFMFKVALVYVLVVEGGFVDLVNWIVNPLLSITSKKVSIMSCINDPVSTASILDTSLSFSFNPYFR